MSEEQKSQEETQNIASGEVVLDDYVKEMIKKVKVQKGLTDQEVKQMLVQAKTSENPIQLLDLIELPKDNYVVFTDGNEQLVYENGEFFIISTIDGTNLPKKKKKRAEAIDLYVEYFIKYQLNPIIEQNKMKQMVNTITKDEMIKEQSNIKEKKVPIKKQEKTKTVLTSPTVAKKQKDNTELTR